MRWAGALVIAAVVALASARVEANKYASLVIDADSGRVLHSVNPDTRSYPASLTKMMTLYLVFEAIEGGRLSLARRLPVSPHAQAQSPTKLGLRAGDTITVKDAILAVVVKSANDMAVVLAEAVGGTETNFALRMTATARRLGMSQTTFRNASGLPHSGQLSTARDMATLARALIRDFPRQYRFFATESFTFDGVTHATHNGLLLAYDGADGIKTGYIHASGYNLVSSARRDGRRLIGVIFGGRSAAARNQRMAELLDKGFAQVAGGPVVAGFTGRMGGGGEEIGEGSRSPAAPPRTGTATAAGEWGVQVGAYNRYSPAYEIARTAVDKAAGALEGGRIKIVPSKARGNRQLFRAQIIGLSRSQAYSACRVLKRRDVACLEMRLGEG